MEELVRKGVDRRTRGRTRLLLKKLGLPRGARFEQADEEISRRIVEARRTQNDEEAAEWSECRAFLKRTLRRLCVGCGVVVKGVTVCAICQRDHLRQLRKVRAAEKVAKARVAAPRGHLFLGKVMVRHLCREFIKEHEVIFQAVLCDYVWRARPDLTPRQVHMNVRCYLLRLKRDGVLEGGGVATWQRYVRVEGKF